MFNLSEPQKAIYYMSVASEDSTTNVAGDVFFDFGVSVEAACRTAAVFLNYCSIMHTRILVRDGVPMQKMDEKNIAAEDIEIKEFDNYSEYKKWACEDAAKPINVYGCLYRLYVIKIEQKVGFYCVTHHIINDATSFNIMASFACEYLKENKLMTIYPYTEYIKNEEAYKLSKRYERDKSFWLDLYNGRDDDVYVENQVTPGKSIRKSSTINRSLTGRIKRYCTNSENSEFSFFMTVIALWYHKNLQKDSFFVGSPMLNRSNLKEERTFGLFVNTVPIPFSFYENFSFEDLCGQTNDLIMSAFRHQKYHYTQLLKDIGNEKKNRKNLFDVIVSYVNAKTSNGAHIGWFNSDKQNESLQIHIEDRENDGVFKIHYNYQIEKFSEKDIENLHNHLCNIITEVIENPDKKISELNMISSDEQKLLTTFNETSHSYDIPEASTLYSLFEKTAKANAEKICIKAGEEAVTFGELLGISEKLDAEIRRITEGKKSVVAVIAERSVEMYAAIYGIIRGGNAYLPVDPDYPQERIAYILENSNAAAVVAQGKFIGKAGDRPCIDMTEFIENTEAVEAVIPACAADENDTAYVIYTSGSTGAPKGARVIHKSAVNRILWMHDKYPLEEKDVILQKTPYTFDVSVWELFWWGMCGGSLAASKPGEHFLPARILEEAEKNSVTHLHFVPSVFEVFLNYLETHKEEINKFDSVRYVFLSGEALSANLVQRFYRLYDYRKVSLHNLYGPTECAVDVTYYDCAPEDADPVPIGKPIYNTQIHILDKHLKPVPVGVTGELCIAGVNVGQGYLNNPELTAERFIDNPFGEGKLYRTGDLAYWREDGNIIFCGRIDDQIKLRGQRIEVGEIESVICSVEGVESVAVVVNQSNTGESLAAFYSGKPGIESEIKECCSDRLPQYMIPVAFEHMERLPLNHNGKLDRKALSKRRISTPSDYVYEPPANASEKLICDKFKTILGIDDVGRNSDFFECGGTSLSMITLLGEEYLENVSVAEFMRNSTPAKLSAIIDKIYKSSLEYLEPLFVPEKANNVLLLLPYAGGGAEAYGNFVASLKRHNKETAVYFIRYLHSFSECEKAAKEISKVLNSKEVYVYSHCVGSAIAIQILKYLEKSGTVVKHYLAGASIPFARPTNKNIWNIVPDSVLKNILIRAGAQLDALSVDKTKEILTRFRKDTDFSNRSFAEFNGKINVPASVIISKRDFFTKNYRKAKKLWNNYFTELNAVYFIESNTHYFQSDNSDDLIDILLSVINQSE